MTDTKLIEQMRVIGGNCGLAADAIEALQAECAEHKENAIRNARIAVSIRAERDQFQVENERLMKEHDELNAIIQNKININNTLGQQFADAISERDALQSRLDAMGKGEPVAFMDQWGEVFRNEADAADHMEGEPTKLYAAPKAIEKQQPVAYRAWFDADNGARWLFTLWPEEERLDVEWEPLYAAPKALAPLPKETYTAIAHRTASKYAHRSDPAHVVYTFFPHTLDDFVRKVEAAHGIGGTP